MSVSEANISWSTISGRHSVKSSNNSSVFLASDRKAGSNVQRSVIRPKCVSAKNSGMRFQSWREPKPLRSRCGSAVHVSHDEDNDKQRPTSLHRRNLKSPRRQTSLLDESNDGLDVVVDRLSKATLSSKHRASVSRPREANVDMNWYSWSKMNVYKAHQGVIYKANGTLRPKSLGKAR